jgi:hypothetical protein
MHLTHLTHQTPLSATQHTVWSSLGITVTAAAQLHESISLPGKRPKFKGTMSTGCVALCGSGSQGCVNDGLECRPYAEAVLPCGLVCNNFRKAVAPSSHCSIFAWNWTKEQICTVNPGQSQKKWLKAKVLLVTQLVGPSRTAHQSAFGSPNPRNSCFHNRHPGYSCDLVLFDFQIEFIQ